MLQAGGAACAGTAAGQPVIPEPCRGGSPRSAGTALSHPARTAACPHCESRLLAGAQSCWEEGHAGALSPSSSTHTGQASSGCWARSAGRLLTLLDRFYPSLMWSSSVAKDGRFLVLSPLFTGKADHTWVCAESPLSCALAPGLTSGCEDSVLAGQVRASCVLSPWSTVQSLAWASYARDGRS